VPIERRFIVFTGSERARVKSRSIGHSEDHYCPVLVVPLVAMKLSTGDISLSSWASWGRTFPCVQGYVSRAAGAPLNPA
jgi:hypothetical protein